MDRSWTLADASIMPRVSKGLDRIRCAPKLATEGLAVLSLLLCLCVTRQLGAEMERDRPTEFLELGRLRNVPSSGEAAKPRLRVVLIELWIYSVIAGFIIVRLFGSRLFHLIVHSRWHL